jgi:hypothetical protein
MRKYSFLLVMLSGYYLSGFAQASSQTKTASRFNDFQGAYVDNYVQGGAEYVAYDDDSYAYTRKLTSRNSYASLVLQGFGFTIPDDAIIENIIVSVRRFKKGKPSIKDYFATLGKKPEMSGFFDPYGVRWTNPDNYPDTETEVIYSQSGTGNNGGPGNQFYQWTPGMVNDPAFGVRIDVYPPVGAGTVVVYYDLVEITVEYSLPAVSKRKSTGVTETEPLKKPIVFPNPFKTKTSILFTAAESGNAVVELYNISGAKLRTLFSGNVVQGQIYNVVAGDAQLPEGIYVYMINNGKQKRTGRIIKLEQ